MSGGALSTTLAGPAAAPAAVDAAGVYARPPGLSKPARRPALRLRAGALLRTFSNISREELAMHILEGERSTWPLLARIRDQTCVSRALDKAILSLRARGADRR